MHLFKKFVFVSLLFSGISLSAFDPGTEFNLSTAYRNDALRRTNSLKSAPLTDQKDHIRLNNINIWQVGVDGRWMTPCNITDCSQIDSILNNLFLNGFAYWGWGGEGARLREEITGKQFFEKQKGKAALKNSRTQDYQIGLGYLLDWNCWDLSVSGGYAYNRQKIETKHGKIAFPSLARFDKASIYGKGYKTTARWKGPWVGTELFYNWCCWRGSLGYEFHFAHYEANHSIPPFPIAQQQGMSSRTKSSRAYGNVIFLDGRYLFCEGWELGLLFKYQYWKATHAHLKSKYFALNGFPSLRASSATGEWTSYAIYFDIGYFF